jgi:two-component system cell cycle sensor histidine kinase PleC
MQHELDLRLLHLFAQASRNSAQGLAAFSFIVAAFSSFFLPFHYVLAWLAPQIFLICFANRFAVSFLDTVERADDLKPWRLRFIGLEAARGLTWGALAGLVLAVSDQPTARGFGFMILLSASAMAATIGPSIPAAVVGSIVSMSAIASIVLVSAGLDVGTLLLVALAACMQLYLVRVAYGFGATALAILSAQIEKDDLIEELAAANATSDLARRRAENANFAKSKFLAAMSHELRTPLNAILGFSEVMKGELFGSHSVESYREYSKDIHESGQHLLGLINEILDLSRIEAGRFELNENAVRLTSVVEDCRHLLALRAKGRSIEITTMAEPELPTIRADERAVRQIVLNLLANAINFTPQGGKIAFKIGWTTRGGQYVCVRDSGPGIPEEEIPTILTPFGRGTLAHENSEEGSGLGLSIVRGLVELHGGNFLLRSKLHEGTEAIVIFPRERVGSSLGEMHDHDGRGAAA